MSNLHHRDTKPEAPPSEAPSPSAYQVQAIVVLTLLFVVLSVMGEYILGSFVGLNIGQDFLLILGGTIGSGICAGLVAGALHHRKP
jgi:hypothetical protein